MGVNLENKNMSLVLPTSRFHAFRKVIAQQIHPDFGNFYNQADEGMFLTGEEEKKFWEAYDKRLVTVDEEFNISHPLLDFLYASDTEGNASVACCHEIYNLIKDYDDNLCYGYCARPNEPRFKDLKALIKDCIESNTELSWW